MKKKLLILQILFVTSCYSFSQNVGIGITTPVERLHVAGNIKADTLKPNVVKIITDAGNGKLLTSDAAGNASWKTVATNAGAPATVGFGSWGDCSMNNIAEYNPVADSAGAPGDVLGFSVAVLGNFAIAGGPQANGLKGSASIFNFNGSNWILAQKLSDPNGTAGDLFGFSVAISGNFAIVGTPANTVGANPAQGAACIFQFNGSTWAFLQKITDPTGAAGDNFGNSVSISGNFITVGAASDDVGTAIDQGSSSVYQFNGNTWIFKQKLTDANGAAGDLFGSSISISGNLAVIGARNTKFGTITNQGSASFYQLNGGNWVFMKKLTDSTNTLPNQRFGNSVSISGNYAAIGAPGNNVAGALGDGSAFVFQLVGNNWGLIQKLTDLTPGKGGGLGTSVCISGDDIIMGGPLNDNSTGAAIIFSKIGSRWQKWQFITDPAGRPQELLGNAVSIDGTTKRFLIGSFGYGNSIGKAIFGKQTKE